jgi:hypothetical protein
MLHSPFVIRKEPVIGVEPIHSTERRNKECTQTGYRSAIDSAPVPAENKRVTLLQWKVEKDCSNARHSPAQWHDGSNKKPAR